MKAFYLNLRSVEAVVRRTLDISHLFCSSVRARTSYTLLTLQFLTETTNSWSYRHTRNVHWPELERDLSQAVWKVWSQWRLYVESGRREGGGSLCLKLEPTVLAEAQLKRRHTPHNLPSR